MQGKEFTVRLQAALNRCRNRALTMAEVIGKPIRLTEGISAAKPPENMTEDEYALCPALAENEPAVRNPTL